MVANLVKLVLHGTGLGEEFATGFYLGHCASVNGEADLATLLDAWDTNMGTTTTPSSWANLAGLISNDQTWDQISAYFYSDSTLPATYLHHKTVAHAGTPSITGMLQQSGVVTLNTARSGASFRGRCYLPTTGLPVSAGHAYTQVNVDKIAAAMTGCMADALQAARAGALGDPTRIVVFSRAKNSVNDVTTVTVDNRPDVQRRRAASQKTTKTIYTGPNPA